MSKIITFIVTFFAMCSTAFASGMTNKVFVSGPLILLFLGFCALVVVIQCIPAVIMAVNLFRGIKSDVTAEKVPVRE